MPLPSGTKLGSYEVAAQIGAGGMGEVYQAHDTKLGRDVALKVLPEAFARDAGRMARFQREAKVLASLNHPNIASIYGLEDSGPTHALVMELVEGPTLADRIKSGPIPVDEAVLIAKQIAEGLEYAHERGIVHRDLKPANVKVSRDDAVKILDFGLAKAVEGEAVETDMGTSPTLTRMATQAGFIIGTAAYMSPEQAKAKPVDRRADIWAFGCVFYEMLTGKMAFGGETVTDILASVVRSEPDWSQLPEGTPLRARVLLQRCLQKDPKQRLRDIGDARISLDEIISGAPLEAPTPGEVAAASGWRAAFSRHTILPWSIVCLIVAALAGLAVWNLKPSPSAPPKPVTRAVINLPPGQQLTGLDAGSALALSPDGTELAYVATQGGTQRIYLRAMDSLNSNPVPGTEGAIEPFFSPNGQWLGFFADGKLKKISVGGGAATDLADASSPHGASWGNQGTILFARNVGAIQQVSDSGGASQPVTRPIIEKGETAHFLPDILPGGQAVLFVAGPGSAQIVVQSLRSGERRDLVPGGASPRYAASGHLLYPEGDNLMAAAFDPKRLQLTGTAVAVLEGILQSANGAAQYSVSETGSLVYVPGGSESAARRLVWVSRNGTEQAIPAPPRDYAYLRISPDGRRLALTIREQESQIWFYDFARDALTRLTFGGSMNEVPVWTQDGKRIAHLSNQGGQVNIFWEPADGSGGPERLTTSEDTNVPGSFSPDGKFLAYVDINPTTGYDIWVLRLSDRKAEPFLQTPSFEGAPSFSPDGRWLAYVSEESGRLEVYAKAYPGPGGKYQISTEGGTEPVWNPKGKELFYRSGDKMMTVDVTTQPNFSAGKPRMLFQGPYLPTLGSFPFYDVSSDGQRFLMLKSVEQEGAASTQINVVLNWFEELKQKVPVEKK
jgi:eukaryotic-like serine/threonine-protein kinase